MRSLIFVGSSLADLRAFPEAVRREAGFQLHAVQCGDEPSDWKTLPSIAHGVTEIRIHSAGEWRIIYVAKFNDTLYVLHCFRKRTRKIPKVDAAIVRSRYKEIGDRKWQQNKT
ncbi:MAG: type II toxin-antitoxin system RelE/ParE family toxin [Bacteroidota bacterium]